MSGWCSRQVQLCTFDTAPHKALKPIDHHISKWCSSRCCTAPHSCRYWHDLIRALRAWSRSPKPPSAQRCSASWVLKSSKPLRHGRYLWASNAGHIAHHWRQAGGHTPSGTHLHMTEMRHKCSPMGPSPYLSIAGPDTACLTLGLCTSPLYAQQQHPSWRHQMARWAVLHLRGGLATLWICMGAAAALQCTCAFAHQKGQCALVADRILTYAFLASSTCPGVNSPIPGPRACFVASLVSQASVRGARTLPQAMYHRGIACGTIAAPGVNALLVLLYMSRELKGIHVYHLFSSRRSMYQQAAESSALTSLSQSPLMVLGPCPCSHTLGKPRRAVQCGGARPSALATSTHSAPAPGEEGWGCGTGCWCLFVLVWRACC